MSNDSILQRDPLELFTEWFQDSLQTSKMREPRAMTLSTVSSQGEPHGRIVLLKEVSSEGLVFYTNYQSEKGQDLSAHSKCEAVFYWDLLHKQVRVYGRVNKVLRAQSEAYWNSRPRESQLSQWISKQSQPCPSREILDQAVDQAGLQFQSKAIPCPEHWGGYVIKPLRFEFWIGQIGRLHDRFRFHKINQTWTSERLYP